MKQFARTAILSVLALLMISAASMTVHATVIVFELDFEFSGSGSEPVGPTPWLTATFDDGGAPGSVSLTMDASGLSGGENVDEWYFNLDPTLDATFLLFTKTASVGTFTDPTIAKGDDNFKAGGDGKYDILLTFAAAAAKRFGDNESLTYNITGIASLTASSFDFFDVGGTKGDFHTAAHVRSTGASGDGSSWIGDNAAPASTPEPSTYLLFVVGILSILGLGYRQRKKAA